MDAVVTQELLTEIFDKTAREVTEQESGIRLRMGSTPPDGELCTVSIPFTRGFHSILSLCAETGLFARLTQGMMRGGTVTPQDIEDFSKEYFNVLCGRIVSRLYQETKVPYRFGIPTFYRGKALPDGYREHFALIYESDENRSAQLIYHIPFGDSAGSCVSTEGKET
ncbi:MAG: chemotaxis protein CheX [Oscillospiraceae bacterium]|nr:chemotaxis protein CheX [Oscillospiraceae bacterium]